MIIALIAVLLALLWINYRVDRSVLYPPFILCFMWMFVFGVYVTHVIEIDPLHWPTLLLVGVGMVLFSLGGLVAMLLPKSLFGLHLNLGPWSYLPQRNTWTKYLLLALCFVGMLLVVHNTFVLGAGASGGNILARARAAGTSSQFQGEASGGGSNPLVVYTPVWSLLFTILFFLERRVWLSRAMAAVAFIAAVFTTGRGPIVMLFCSLMAAYLLRENRVRIGAALRMIRLPAAVGFALYVILIFTNKNVSQISGGVLGIIIFVVGSYFVSPLAGLDYVLQHPEQYAHEPNHTFKFFLAAAAKLHLIAYQPPPLLDDFVSVPFPTNVYTAFKFWYTDFGIAGCLLTVCLVGFVHSALYRKARTGSELGIFLFSATCFPAVMFIFDDLYSAFGEHLDILAVGLLYFATRSFLVRSSPVSRFRSRTTVRLRILPSGALPRFRMSFGARREMEL